MRTQISTTGPLAASGVLAVPRTLGFSGPRDDCGRRQVAPDRLRAPDLRAASERLARAVRFRTVSPADSGSLDASAFLGLHAFIEQAFPRVHQTLRRETIGDLSLLYTWEGSDPALTPILLSAHMDVVPVLPDSEDRWSHEPFAGQIVDGFVWGRGALDDKAAVLGVLEAVECLIAEGFRPESTIYLAFGHDEERGGLNGAARIAALLQSRGVRLGYVLDEGLVVVDGLIPGARKPVALIGVAEKGRMALELIARGPDGHASMPPPRGAIGALAHALDRLESHPMPAAIRSPVRELFETIAPGMSPVARLVFSNLRLFEPLVTRVLAHSRAANAAIRTTTAVTMVSAGNKDNVLPGLARAVVDVRILPGDSTAAVVAHVRRVIDDPSITIRTLHTNDPSPVAPMTGPGFEMLAATAHQVFPEAVVAPGLLVAGTDGKHYVPLTSAVYRFRPLQLTREDLERIHGVDERIAVASYADVIGFYTRFFENMTRERRRLCSPTAQ